MSKIDPANLSIAAMAKLLSAAGGTKVSAADVKADVERGAPTNRDGTLHLVHYTAWLAAQAD